MPAHDAPKRPRRDLMVGSSRDLLMNTESALSASDRSLILDQIEGPRDPVILYGSHARRDQHARSDIDVLQIVGHRRCSYRRGRLSVTTATEESLRSLARAGSIFVLHLRTEGVVLRDDASAFERVVLAYRAPDSYGPLRESLRLAAGLLDVDEAGFVKNPRGFTQLAVYLLRTALYLRCAEEGRPLFSMARVAERFADRRILDIFRDRLDHACDVIFFQRVRSLLEEQLGARAVNHFGSIEALAVQAYDKSPLASALAVRLLSGASLEYEELLPDGIAP